MNEEQLLQVAAQVLERESQLKRQKQENDRRLRELCRAYDMVAGTRCIQPHHLRRECERRGMFDGEGQDHPVSGQLRHQATIGRYALRGI